MAGQRRGDAGNEVVSRGAGRAWPLDRVLFALAGSVTLLGTVLGALLSPWFLLLPVFVGVNQWIYASKGDCPASFVLKRLGVQGGWSEQRGVV